MRKIHILPSLFILAFASMTAAQTTILVPSQVNSILGAIALAQNGDTILVAPGTYNEANVNFLGKSIKLMSSGGPQVTTIDALGAARVMRFITGETAASVVQGFTLRGGATPDGQDGTSASRDGGSGGDGAGIEIQNASPTFVDCIIEDHTTGDGGDGFVPAIGELGSLGGRGGDGAGVYIDGGSPTFSNCEFKNNKTGSGGQGEGSGFAIGMTPTYAQGGRGGDGAGIFVKAGAPTFTNCLFMKNKCGDGGNGSDGSSLGAESGPGGRGGNGGAIYFLAGSSTVTATQFRENESGDGGDAGNTIGGDASPGGDGGNGAAVFSGSMATPQFLGSVFEDNKCGDGGVGGASGAFFSVAGDPAIGGFGGSGGAMAFEGSPQVDSCQFYNNRCGDGGVGGQGFGVASGVGGFGGSGGAINLNGGVGLVVNCIFVANSAGNGNDSGASDGAAGGGGAAGVGGAVIIVAGGLSVGNCTIINNKTGDPGLGISPGASGIGGGIFAFGGAMDVANTIVRGNTANGSPSNIFNLGIGILIVAFSDVEGSYAGISNFDLDPLFVDEAGGDYRLTENSPCRDAGDVGFGFIPALDFEGDPRVICGTLDVGADEFNLMPLAIGQEPRAGFASLDISNAKSLYGCTVDTEAPGPYKTTITAGTSFGFDIEGSPLQPIILMWAPLNVRVATYPAPIGQFDIGGLLDLQSGIPMGLTVFADGTTVYLPNNGIATDATGLSSTSYVMPASIPPGIFTTFQAAVFHPLGVALSNAVQIEIAP